MRLAGADRLGATGLGLDGVLPTIGSKELIAVARRPTSGWARVTWSSPRRSPTRRTRWAPRWPARPRVASDALTALGPRRVVAGLAQLAVEPDRDGCCRSTTCARSSPGAASAGRCSSPTSATSSAPGTAEPVSVLHPDVCDGDHRGILAVHSLSKRSNLAGYRCAFVAGDPAVVAELLAVRKNLGLMMPGPQQAAMRAALDDDEHVARAAAALRRLGGCDCARRSRAPASGSTTREGVALPLGDARRALLGHRRRPGGPRASSSRPATSTARPARRHVRVALTATDERVAAAAARLASDAGSAGSAYAGRGPGIGVALEVARPAIGARYGDSAQTRDRGDALGLHDAVTPSRHSRTMPTPSLRRDAALEPRPSISTPHGEAVLGRAVDRHAHRVEHRVDIGAPSSCGPPLRALPIRDSSVDERDIPPATLRAHSGPRSSRESVGPPTRRSSVRSGPVDHVDVHVVAVLEDRPGLRARVRVDAAGRSRASPSSEDRPALQIRSSKMTCSIVQPRGVGDEVRRDRPARAPVVVGRPAGRRRRSRARRSAPSPPCGRCVTPPGAKPPIGRSPNTASRSVRTASARGVSPEAPSSSSLPSGLSHDAAEAGPGCSRSAPRRAPGRPRRAPRRPRGSRTAAPPAPPR